MDELSILEIAENAKINFENVVKMNPVLARYPLFAIGMEQLKKVIKRLEEDE